MSIDWKNGEHSGPWGWIVGIMAVGVGAAILFTVVALCSDLIG